MRMRKKERHGEKKKKTKRERQRKEGVREGGREGGSEEGRKGRREEFQLEKNKNSFRVYIYNMHEVKKRFSYADCASSELPLLLLLWVGVLSLGISSSLSSGNIPVCT